MSNRSWFYAAGDQQQGPFSEDQLRDFIARGAVRADTYVWTEGMPAWQRAGDIPGLLNRGTAPDAAMPSTLSRTAAPMTGTGGASLSVDFSLWEMLGRAIVFVIGFLLVIPAPWVATSFYKWFVGHVRVPQRPNLEFAGQPMDIWWVFVLLALTTYAGVTGIPYLRLILIPVQAYLSWMTVRWIVANISSNGQPLQFTFMGEALHYVGWYVLLNISFITIIGWAWVTTAWTRWMFRHVDGPRREIVFNASGLDVLWRTLVFAVGCAFIIPIPWVLGWYTRWYVSQIALVERA
ncbi:MAG TPA: GYF domain-containing protein [Nitrobacter sp.]|nr:GYF domain-containing protein [Nitrobacter sp.]